MTVYLAIPVTEDQAPFIGYKAQTGAGGNGRDFKKKSAFFMFIYLNE